MSWGRRRRDFRGRKIIMISIAIFVFSELKETFGIFQDAHEVMSANLIGVPSDTYNNNNLPSWRASSKEKA